jgi:DNA helicase-2/ATP-dependent DNA helicase PcrA
MRIKVPHRKILGPPGTGKTTKLIAEMKELLAKGVKPQAIAFVSFTKRAADHAKQRVMKELNLTEADLPWFRTLHSFSFHFHNLDASLVMNWNDYQVICRSLGYTISSVKMTPEEFMNHQQTSGDRLFFLENLARTTGNTLNDVHRAHPNEDLDVRELHLLSKTLADYKAAQGKMDFTDMIKLFVDKKQSPQLEALILDEAQDLSALQWDMVEVLIKYVKYFIMAGDDDQAIYSWAGADVGKFIYYKADEEVLTKSYRVPKAVHTLATKIVKKIAIRTIKDYQPTDEEGKVEWVSDLAQIDMTKGTWLLLARNIFMLSEYDRYCVERGLYYESRFGSGVNQGIGKAIRYYELMRSGSNITAGMAKAFYEFMSTKREHGKVKWGCKKDLANLADEELVDMGKLMTMFGLRTQDAWVSAFDLISDKERAFYRTILRNGEDLLTEPRIHINTIHGIKGGEAENVVLMSDMSFRTYEEYQKYMDAEYRVWYVGITRAKSNLYILQPRTQYFIAW